MYRSSCWHGQNKDHARVWIDGFMPATRGWSRRTQFQQASLKNGRSSLNPTKSIFQFCFSRYHANKMNDTKCFCVSVQEISCLTAVQGKPARPHSPLCPWPCPGTRGIEEFEKPMHDGHSRVMNGIFDLVTIAV